MQNWVRACFALSAALAASTGFVSAGHADARKGPVYELVYSFCPDAPTCTGGYDPTGVYALPTGDVYGTGNGNDAQPGTTGFIFKLTHGKGTKYSFSQYYDFPSCNQDGTCPNGRQPYGLIIGQSGAIYGLAQGGDANGDGILFKISPGGGSEEVLHTFCEAANCGDGSYPSTITYDGAAEGKAWDEQSPLYGTAQGGGNANYEGTIFKYDPGTNQFTTLYDFCKSGPQSCRDGHTPIGPIAISGTTLYGVNNGNGSYSGIIYRFSLKTHRLALAMHGFPTGDTCNSGQDDGCYPTGGLVLAGHTLAGLTTGGGTNNVGAQWSYDLPTGTYTSFDYFCVGCSGGGGTDGGYPTTNLVAGAQGKFYGATAEGGQNGYGTVFQGADNPLYNFGDGASAQWQNYAILAHANGAVFWVNTIGGAYSWGGVYLVTTGN